MEENKKKKSKLKFGLIYVITFFVVAFIFTKVVSFPVVYGSSMEPTYHEKNVLLLDKWNCKTVDDISRYDVVVAFPKLYNLLVIKRVIGLPGETVLIENGKVYINGDLLVENFPEIENPGIAGIPYTLGDDEFFLMGDNRNASDDSRVFGPVRFEQIHGIVRKKF